MNQPFRIEKKEQFRVLGTRVTTTNKKRAASKAVPQQWALFQEQEIKEQLMPLMDQEPYGLFGISVYNTFKDDPYKLDYYIGVSSSGEESAEFTSYVVPEATWAIFPCTVATIGKTEVQAISKWLPKSNYKPLNAGYITGKMKSGAPDIEYYGENGEAEVWIAVRER